MTIPDFTDSELIWPRRLDVPAVQPITFPYPLSPQMVDYYRHKIHPLYLEALDMGIAQPLAARMVQIVMIGYPLEGEFTAATKMREMLNLVEGGISPGRVVTNHTPMEWTAYAKTRLLALRTQKLINDCLPTRWQWMK
jgi:hypothetical protein